MASLKNYYSGPELSKKEILERMDKFPGGTIDLEKNEVTGIATITINHVQKKNAISGSMLKKLHDRIEELESWESGKGVILMGKDGKFTSGGDFHFVLESGNPNDGFAMTSLVNDITCRLERLPMLVVSLIEEFALGGGSELAMACDFRLIIPNATMGFIHMKLGIVPMWAGFTRLAHIIGKQKAFEHVTRAQPVKAEKALEIGMVDEILPGVNPKQEAEQWLLQHIQGSSQDMIGTVKQMLLNTRNLNYDQSLLEERRLAAPYWGCEAQRNVIKRFLNKKNKM